MPHVFLAFRRLSFVSDGCRHINKSTRLVTYRSSHHATSSLRVHKWYSSLNGNHASSPQELARRAESFRPPRMRRCSVIRWQRGLIMLAFGHCWHRYSFWKPSPMVVALEMGFDWGNHTGSMIERLILVWTVDQTEQRWNRREADRKERS